MKARTPQKRTQTPKPAWHADSALRGAGVYSVLAKPRDDKQTLDFNELERILYDHCTTQHVVKTIIDRMNLVYRENVDFTEHVTLQLQAFRLVMNRQVLNQLFIEYYPIPATFQYNRGMEPYAKTALLVQDGKIVSLVSPMPALQLV